MKTIFKILDIIAHVVVIYGILLIGMGLRHIPEYVI